MKACDIMYLWDCRSSDSLTKISRAEKGNPAANTHESF
jgi:hypothetical protein